MATKGDREAEREIKGGEMEGTNKRKKKGGGDICKANHLQGA